MTTEPKLFTEQQVRDLHGLPQDALVAFFQAHGLIAEEPVDPLLKEAREMAARAFADMGKDDLAIKTRNGENDGSATVHEYLAAIRRGHEIGLAERPTLTREVVRELIIDARPKYLSPGDFQGRYGKKNKEAAEAFVTRLHTALQDALQ